MYFNPEKVTSIVQQHYPIKVDSVKPLPGELDYNYYIEAKDGRIYIFKIANANESKDNLVLQHEVIHHLISNNFGLTVSEIIAGTQNEEIIQLKDEAGRPRLARLLTWVEGRVLASVNPHSTQLLFRLGEMCGKLAVSLNNFDHPSAHRFIKWDLAKADWVREHLNRFKDDRKELVDYFYFLFENQVKPAFPELRKSVIYNDANDYNVLVSDDITNPRVPGVIDFGDVVYTYTINELAIALAYAIMNKPNPMEAARPIVKGFHSVFPLTEPELNVLFPLVGTRLLISVVNSELNRLQHPDNKYLQISDSPAWDLLFKLKSISPEWAHCVFREACGITSSPKEAEFRNWVKKNHQELKFPVTKGKTETWLDLSVGSLDLGNSQDIFNADKLDEKISSIIRERNVDLAYGKYNEARAIYATPAYEVVANEGQSWRTIHIGLDFFCKAGSPVRAVYSGIVHSFANNQADRDYGPTVILEHRVSDTLTFYTLYGHLNIECLKTLSKGQPVQAGEEIGRIGFKHENGNWTPHLHFQVMLHALGNQGDFPGVCIPEEAPVWTSICPDPWFVLTGNESPADKSLSTEEIVSFRKRHVGKNLSISYKQPIKMVRGAGQYLVDSTGRRYLDTVNNVAHVGHEHPRVVQAGQRQMAVLNTNTRYLHDNMVKFVEELLTTMPPELNVVFLVNSGSEANELALRLAKTYTSQNDMIVSQVGYHGNTNACVEISSYKFDGPGGKGKQPHIHVIPIPDTYRGLYRDNDPKAGSKYAQHVRQAIEDMASQKKKPAAFIFESVISCGGQVVLPENFLKECYAFTRTAGGVCIADEVQTGCGRAGDHYWAFEKHGVVPDIVTIGKPIGNGHPLGVVVTTQALADAFKNGMEYFNTFGGNPVSCAIGLEVLRVVKEENLQHHAKIVGGYLSNGLKQLMNQYEVIGDVRGPGLFIGFELVRDRTTREPATEQASYLANRMRDLGILMSTDGPFNNVMKIKPPMVFSNSDADFLLESLDRVFKEDRMKYL
jgi:4-aminobutyrate aminotransferase-like enzyme/Ser/Thr protein kinase RdoA (MazF antagonist)